MSPKVAAAIRHLSARDKVLGRVARTIDIRVVTPAPPWFRHGTVTAIVASHRLAFIRPVWGRAKVEAVAYSIGWMAYVVKHRPDRALRKAGAFANSDKKRTADLAANVAIRRHLDKQFGYQNRPRPFERKPFEQTIAVGSLGPECCDDTACVYRAMSTFPSRAIKRKGMMRGIRRVLGALAARMAA